MEWLPIVAAAIAGILLLQTNAPHISPDEAPKHEGNQVAVTGTVVEQNGNWFTLAAGGTALQGWSKEPPAQGLVVQAKGRIESDPWTLFTDSWKTTPAEFPEVSMQALRENPQTYLFENLQINGQAEGRSLTHGGSTVQLNKPLQGPVRVNGIIQYQPDCLCHQLVIHSWTSS